MLESEALDDKYVDLRRQKVKDEVWLRPPFARPSWSG